MGLESTGLNIIDYNLKWDRPLAKSRSKIEYIILHHDMWLGATMEDIHRDHIVHRRWRGTGYNIRIRQNGDVELGREVGMVAAHCSQDNMNYRSIGLVFEGCYTNEGLNLRITKEMPKAQFDAGVKVLRFLMKEYNIGKNKILPHRYYATWKDCPGTFFPLANLFTEAFKPEVKQHWAEEHYLNLINKGIVIHEKRFDDNLTRGEALSLMNEMIKYNERILKYVKDLL